jgi:hypothetical protein
MAEYRLTPAAERDLEGIWAYSYHRWGAERANRYIDHHTVGKILNSLSGGNGVATSSIKTSAT